MGGSIELCNSSKQMTRRGWYVQRGLVSSSLCRRESSKKNRLDCPPLWMGRHYPFSPPKVLMHRSFLFLLFLLVGMLIPFTDFLVAWGDRPCSSLSPACWCGSDLLAPCELDLFRASLLTVSSPSYLMALSIPVLLVIVIFPTWQGVNLFLCCLLANKFHVPPPLIYSVNASSISLVFPLAAA